MWSRSTSCSVSAAISRPPSSSSSGMAFVPVSSSSRNTPPWEWALQARRTTRRTTPPPEDDDDEAFHDSDEIPDDDDDVMLNNERGSRGDDNDGDVMLLGEDDDVEPDDVPDDWTEQDILAELGDDVGAADLVNAVGGRDVDDDDIDLDIDIETDVEVVSRVVADKSAPTDADTDALRYTDDDEDLDLEDVDIEDVDLDFEEEEEDDIEEESGDGDVTVYDDVVWEGEEDAMLSEIEGDEWDVDEDGGVYELLDDPDDPNYQQQKELVEAAIQAADERARDEAFDPFEFVTTDMTPEQSREMDQLPFFKQVEEQAQSMMLTPKDIETLDLDAEVKKVSDYLKDDPYPRHEADEINFLEQDVGLSDRDMESLDNAYKEIQRIVDEEPWDKVMVKDSVGWDGLSNQTLEEMAAALDELGGSAYNVTRWLLYDLDFNVTNLMLAAVKHNPNAPILFQHWYPQLATYERYSDARAMNFDFTWHDVEQADLTELERYYAGFGYDTIPDKAPAETGIIGFEELDEEEIKMAAFENWMTQVYNSEWDRTDFDDDDMKDELNVFSEFYDPPEHPDLPSLEDAKEDIDEWKAELDYETEYDEEEDPAVKSYRDMLGQKFDYEVVKDEEFERDFRGHLVVACTGSEHDLEVAEKISNRFAKEFGKQVFVETRVMALAREEDNVFEVWLESYEIDLLHSKKRATSNTQDWQGPAECDDAQIDSLADQVRFLISDEARYSYRMDLEHVDA